MATTATAPTIFDAAARGSLEEIESMIAADKGSVTTENVNGRSALSLAVQKGHLKVVNALLNAGAVDSTVADWTAVHHAAFGGHSEVCGIFRRRLFLSLAGRVTDISHPSVLCCCVCLQVMSALAAKLGAAVLTPSGSGMSPLLLAASKGNVACLTLLLDAAPSSVNDTDVNERTALMLAASGGSAEAVELLVERGANINAVSIDGKSALMWAIVAHKPATTAALARLGADPSIAQPVGDVIVPGQDRNKGETAEDLANAKHAKDPTLRHIAKFMKAWREARVAGEPVPEMPPLPWVSHATTWYAKEAEREAAEAAKAAEAADEPKITEVAQPDENDIFGDADVSPAVIEEVPVGGDDADHKAEAEAAQKAIAADADLDELD